MQTTKDYASTLWTNLSQGLDALYEKYKTLRQSSEQEYDNRLVEIAPQYQSMRNAASTQSRIAQANTDERLAARGLSTSGEGLKRDLLEKAALQENLTAIDLAEANEIRSVEAEKAKASSSLAAKESEEISKYIYQMNEAYFDQLNADREQALAEEKLRITEEQNAFERSMQEAQLALKREQQAFEQTIEKALADAKIASSSSSSKSSSSSSQSTSSGGSILGVGGSYLLNSQMSTQSHTPESYDARELVNDIAKECLTTDDGGEKVYDQAKLKRSLSSVINNTSLSTAYRYEVSVYAKAMGYL